MTPKLTNTEKIQTLNNLNREKQILEHFQSELGAFNKPNKLLIKTNYNVSILNWTKTKELSIPNKLQVEIGVLLEKHIQEIEEKINNLLK